MEIFAIRCVHMISCAGAWFRVASFNTLADIRIIRPRLGAQMRAFVGLHEKFVFHIDTIIPQALFPLL